MSIDSSCLIMCKVVPKANKSAIMGWEEGVLKIRLAAVPEKGQANDALIRVLASTLNIPKRDIQIVSGETSRQKRVKISGLTEEEVRTLTSEA